MLRKLIFTDADYGALAGRVMLGAIILPHGFQHALGLFGGYGFSGTLGWMTQTLGFPTPLAALAILSELVAPFALIAGFGGRVASLGIIGIMAGAISTHASNGFFMNWFGTLPAGTEGFEYHLLAIGLAAVVSLNGSGALSIDQWFSRRFAQVDAAGIARTHATIPSSDRKAA
jgi:putative oxidoreductase